MCARQMINVFDQILPGEEWSPWVLLCSLLWQEFLLKQAHVLCTPLEPTSQDTQQMTETNMLSACLADGHTLPASQSRSGPVGGWWESSPEHLLDRLRLQAQMPLKFFRAS